MKPMVMGIESEMSISPSTQSPLATSRHALAAFRDDMKIPWMKGTGLDDMFLSNGARLYLDCGSHVEYATPECLDPKEVVKYAFSGYRTIGEMARLGHCHAWRHNFDYASGDTWGCHESYSMRSVRSVSAIKPHVRHGIIAHLVSRTCFSGAGGLVGSKFSVSPRLNTFTCEMNDSSTSDRPILNLRDEPMSKDGVRLHIICGDMLCSQYATWLKIATTALVVRMYDAGAGPKVLMHDSLGAMKAFIADTSFRASETMTTYSDDERKDVQVTALDLQSIMHEAVKARLGEEWMPNWAAEVVAEWGSVIAALKQGELDSLAYKLDWVTKKKMFDAYVESKGLRWDGTRIAEEQGLFGAEPSTTINHLAFANLIAELREIDLRFGELGDGLADGMAGTLEYQTLFDDASIAMAMDNPPSDTRAAVRGIEIAKEHASGSRKELSRANWDFIQKFIYGDTDVAHMTDVLDTTPIKWIEPTPPPPDDPSHIIALKAGDWVVLDEHKGSGRLKCWDSVMTGMIGRMYVIDGSTQIDSSGRLMMLLADKDGRKHDDRRRVVYWRAQSLRKIDTPQLGIDGRPLIFAT